MEISIPTEALIAIGSALIGSFAGAVLALRIEKRKDRLADEKSRIQRCSESCRLLDDLLAEWYTAIYDAVTFKETADETIAALRRFEAQPNFERRLRRILDDLADEPSCKQLRELAWSFRDKCLGAKTAVTMTFAQEFEGRFPRGYGLAKNEAMAMLLARSKDFNDELTRVTDRLRVRAKEIRL